MYQAMQSAFGATLELQHFQAVQGPGAAQSVHILEVFASGVHKWRGLAWLARRHGIEADEIAAIGDEINDLALLEQVGCPIAMANAVEPVLRVGRHVTRSCDEDGVAYAIDKILDGEWV